MYQEKVFRIGVKGPLHPNSSIVVNMYLTYLNIFAKIRSRYLVSVTRKLVKYRFFGKIIVFRTLPKTLESFAKALAVRKLLEVAFFLGCWYPMTSRIYRYFTSFLVTETRYRDRIFAKTFKYIKYIFITIDEFGCSGPLSKFSDFCELILI